MAQYVVDEAPFLSGLAAARASRERFNEDQNRALRYQELQSQDALRKVQERQAAERTAILMEQQNQKIQQQADTAKAWQQTQLETSPVLPAPGMLGGVMPNPDPMPMYRSLLKNMGPVIAKYKPENFGTFVQDMALLPYREAEAKRQEALAKEEANGGFQPSSTSVTMPDGTQVQGIKTSKNTFQPMIEPSVQMIDSIDPDTGQPTKVPVLRQGMTGARALPQNAAKRQADRFVQENHQKVLAFALEHAPEKVKAVSDAAGRVQYTIAPEDYQDIAKRAQVTSAVQTKAETSLMGAEKSVSELASLEKTLRPEDVGPAGVLGEAIFDKLLPIVGVDTSSISRMDNREKMRTLIEGSLRQMTDDQRFSNGDRADIKEAMPKPGIPESYPHAMQTIRTLRQVFSKRALIDAKTVGKPAPTWALLTLDPAKLREANDANLIDDNAIRTLVRNRKITPEEGAQLQADRPKG